MEANGIVKNTGPDLAKILGTLRFFGPRYPYLILGYPPFLKHFIDVAEQEGFPFEQYRLDALVGGEGMSEGLRDYLLKRFRRVFSGYGATDVEIGIAGETPLAVAVRRLAWKDPKVKLALFGPDSRLPMLFQYNPLMHHIEVNRDRELLFTINRDSVLSPRIRYNVHDEGGVARYDCLEATLRALGHNLRDLVPGSARLLRLPFLWIYGRRDSTISVMGANIYPEDLEQCLYCEPELARITRSFCLSLSHGHPPCRAQCGLPRGPARIRPDAAARDQALSGRRGSVCRKLRPDQANAADAPGRALALEETPGGSRFGKRGPQCCRARHPAGPAGWCSKG